MCILVPHPRGWWTLGVRVTVGKLDQLQRRTKKHGKSIVYNVYTRRYAVCEIHSGPIDKVYMKSCWSIEIQKAVDRLVYRISYKVKGFITFGFGYKITEKIQVSSNNLGLASIFIIIILNWLFHRIQLVTK